jgi:hypothetical protein
VKIWLSPLNLLPFSFCENLAKSLEPLAIFVSKFG